MEKQLREALLRISELPKDELCEIYNKTNSWQWDERLGDIPEDFEDLPNYYKNWYHEFFRRRSKEKYIRPICDAIESIVGEKELLRYHHLHNLKNTNEEFEKFWKRQQITRKTGIVLYPFEIPNNISRDNGGNNSQKKS